MKFKKVAICLISALIATEAFAWDLWDEFKRTNVDEQGRVIDYSDPRHITTSEGQSYAMFFALVANDRKAFDQIFQWSENNLGPDQPAWLWGIPTAKAGDPGKIIDTNNATDSDMWIAYCLLEAARMWNDKAYEDKANAYLRKLKELVRTIPGVGQVILPGRVGFEEKGVITINPSYYPPHILRRFAEYDSSWQPVLEGSINALLRCSLGGASPDWAKFDKNGRLIDQGKLEGSYNAIRSYLWASILSPKDPNYKVLLKLYMPMIELVKRVNIPPETVKLEEMKVSTQDVNAFGACFLPYVTNDKAGSVIRTVLTSTKMEPDGYYRNVLTAFGLGFDYRNYAFDEKGQLIIPKDNLVIESETPK